MCLRNINQLPLTCPQSGTWPTARHVPWPETEPVTFWFAGRPTHWATLVRAMFHFCLKEKQDATLIMPTQAEVETLRFLWQLQSGISWGWAVRTEAPSQRQPSGLGRNSGPPRPECQTNFSQREQEFPYIELWPSLTYWTQQLCLRNTGLKQP